MEEHEGHKWNFFPSQMLTINFRLVQTNENYLLFIKPEFRGEKVNGGKFVSFSEFKCFSEAPLILTIRYVSLQSNWIGHLCFCIFTIYSILNVYWTCCLVLLIFTFLNYLAFRNVPGDAYPQIKYCEELKFAGFSIYSSQVVSLLCHIVHLVLYLNKVLNLTLVKADVTVWWMKSSAKIQKKRIYSLNNSKVHSYKSNIMLVDVSRQHFGLTV